MVRPAPKYRKAVVAYITKELAQAWDAMIDHMRANEELEFASTSATTLPKYVEELEGHIYDRHYLLDSLDAYRHKTVSIVYNLKHNGSQLFWRHAPIHLVTLSDEALATAHPTLSPVPAKNRKPGNLEAEDHDEKGESKGIKAQGESEAKEEEEEEEEEEEGQGTKHARNNKDDEGVEGHYEYLPLAVTRKRIAGRPLQTNTMAQSNEVASELEKLKPEIPGAIGCVVARNLLSCRYCPPGTKVDWYGRQSKGADESETIHCECTLCHRKWKS